MFCKQCKKNKIDRFKKLKICNSCWYKNYLKKHPEKYRYKYGGMASKVFKRDSYKCVLCKEDKKKKLLIHHLDGNGSYKNNKRLKIEEQNNDINNLVTLCNCCHAKIHKRGGTKINTWSKKYNKCIVCNTTEKCHNAKGLCKKCYTKKYSKENLDKIKKWKVEWYQKRGKYLEKLRKFKQGIDKHSVL